MKTHQFIGVVAGAYNDCAMWHKTQEGHYHVSVGSGAFQTYYKATVDDYGTLVPVFKYMF